MGRITLHAQIFYIVMGKFSFSEYISRSDVLNIRTVIVNLGGITMIHFPQVLTNVIFPAKRQVNYHGTGYFRYLADQPFRYSILIMRIDAKITKTLVMLMNGLNKTILFEDTVIRKITIDHNTMIQAYFFMVLSSLNSFYTRKSKFTLSMDISTHIINKNVPSYKLFRSYNSKVSICTNFQ